MATTDTTPQADATHEGVHEHDEHHPTVKEYVQIAVVLGVLTAMEIAASFIELGWLFMPTLIVLMIIKFVLVAGFFMHLKDDTRLYSRVLVTGLALAVGLYAIVLALFTFQRGLL
jgi:cytochrome c oxidase subunit 4